MSETGRARGLGRGLSALLGEPARQDYARAEPAVPPSPAASPAPEGAAVIRAFAPPAFLNPIDAKPAEIPLDDIAPNPNQPRRAFDQTELNELAESIRQHGVLQPVLLRPRADDPTRYEIVAGERRWRAARIAGKASVPAIVRAWSDSEILEIAIVENVQRADLNPMEEAQGYDALMTRFGRTQAEVASVVGKSRPHVANTLRLLMLPGEIQEMVREGALSAGHARAILTAPDPLALAKRAIRQALSVREIERLAARAKDVREPGEGGGKDADIKALETRVARALGSPAAITVRPDGTGDVRLSFRHPVQLDEIVRRLVAED